MFVSLTWLMMKNFRELKKGEIEKKSKSRKTGET
jgi:hypothetical protein